MDGLGSGMVLVLKDVGTILDHKIMKESESCNQPTAAILAVSLEFSALGMLLANLTRSLTW